MNKIILSFLIIFAFINLSSFIIINFKLNKDNFCSACTGGGGGGSQMNSSINPINVFSSNSSSSLNSNSSLDTSSSNLSEVNISSSKNKKINKRFLM